MNRYKKRKVSNRDLTLYGVVVRNREKFIEYFKMKGVAGIRMIYEDGDTIRVTATNKLSYHPTLGMTQYIDIEAHKFNTWRNNIELFKFVNTKI